MTRLVVLGALISVSITSRLFAEYADNQRHIYPDLYTAVVRSVFQAFCIICIALTLAILLIHLYGARFRGPHFSNINRLCSTLNIIMGLMMLSMGICSALWEDKLRRTPAVVNKGYYSYRERYLFGEPTYGHPGAAAAAAAFGFLAAILYFIEACTRPTLDTETRHIPISNRNYVNTTETPINYQPQQYYPAKYPITTSTHERIIPVETTINRPSY
ncbi:unnamed protein product [Didymodactylos carnosus]|uniref:MARVEL domain-containing protein n=1 Tax=Didymodactylos carnosus TaxID=1234261 RepID=A0A813QI61_9BILA|nr:unnamed protein product [Didymodactylos carnosus]CAF3549130.1 unnamed protein product [Didymodactylos carnosus]